MTTDWVAAPTSSRPRPLLGRSAIPAGHHINLSDSDAPGPRIDPVVMERLINGEPSAARTTERYAAAHYLHHHQPDLALRQIARLVGTSRRSTERWNANGWPTRWNHDNPTPTPIWKEPTAMDWRHHAVCRKEDTELFFPVGNTGPALAQIDDAKAVCHRCPVEDQCGQWALDQRIEHGIWGGLSEDERRSILRRKTRQAAKTAPAPCGTRTAYNRHTRRGETPCEQCRTANTTYANQRNTATREAATA